MQLRDNKKLPKPKDSNVVKQVEEIFSKMTKKQRLELIKDDLKGLDIPTTII